MFLSRHARLALALTAALGISAPVAQAEQTVVVELFTSQGCNACPPADRLLGELAGEPGVIALAYHVDYWDYLGWSDTFASKAFTQRQEFYVGRADRSGIKQRLRGKFTPEIVIQGTHSLVGHDQTAIRTGITNHQEANPAVAMDLVREGGIVTVRCKAQVSGLGDLRVMVARYMPKAEVEIARGENAGRTLTYHHVVTDLTEIDRWDSTGSRTINFEGEGPLVVFVQRREDGAIVAAGRID